MGPECMQRMLLYSMPRSSKASLMSVPVVPVQTRLWPAKKSALKTAQSIMSTLRLSCATSAIVNFLCI